MGKRELALGALALVVVAMPMAQANAAVCKRPKFTAMGGWRVTFVGARAKARTAWKRKASQRYGSRLDT